MNVVRVNAAFSENPEKESRVFRKGDENPNLGCSEKKIFLGNEMLVYFAKN